FDGARELVTIDGLRADYADGFGLVRASNTTPVLVLRFEGHTPQALERIQQAFMTALRAVKPDAQFASAAH
ncbi:MAG TPA: phosphomannomutase/phosphoglucomutase, partial [Burkholderiaceae bacterium]|nr:phosphomannomutase/phosphoglucomutase [Burkholderiaceae bacterium]